MAKLTREGAREKIHAAGMRATPPRVAVLRLLSEVSRPLSHAEVVDAAGQGEWDQATVYRNLQRLVEVDLARVASQIGGITRYEAINEDAPDHVHPHFACRNCGNVECLVDTTVSVPKDPRWRAAFDEAELQLVGECPSCRGKRRGAARKGGRKH